MDFAAVSDPDQILVLTARSNILKIRDEFYSIGSVYLGSERNLSVFGARIRIRFLTRQWGLHYTLGLKYATAHKER